MKNKASKGYEENYFFIFREGDGVYYNELETRCVVPASLPSACVCPGLDLASGRVPDPLFRLPCRVRLSKRRAKAGVQSGTNALLVVKHRDMNEKELEAQVRAEVAECPQGWGQGELLESFSYFLTVGSSEGPAGEP